MLLLAQVWKQSTYRIVALGTNEMLWLWNILKDLRYGPKEAMKLYCDNKAACQIAANTVHHDRTNIWNQIFFSIKKKLDKKIIEIPRVKFEDQFADVLTKTVMNMIFVRFVGKLGMFDIYMIH